MRGTADGRRRNPDDLREVAPLGEVGEVRRGLAVAGDRVEGLLAVVPLVGDGLINIGVGVGVGQVGRRAGRGNVLAVAAAADGLVVGEDTGGSHRGSVAGQVGVPRDGRCRVVQTVEVVGVDGDGGVIGGRGDGSTGVEHAGDLVGNGRGRHRGSEGKDCCRELHFERCVGGCGGGGREKKEETREKMGRKW